jgi:hypothetical protein
MYNILGGNQNDEVNLKAFPASSVLSIRRVTEKFIINANIRQIIRESKESPSVAIETPIP